MRLNFSLIQHNKITLTEIENMMPWEREAYLTLLTNQIQEEQEQSKTTKWLAKIKIKVVETTKEYELAVEDIVPATGQDAPNMVYIRHQALWTRLG